jgi:hypothetical protein
MRPVLPCVGAQPCRHTAQPNRCPIDAARLRGPRDSARRPHANAQWLLELVSPALPPGWATLCSRRRVTLEWSSSASVRSAGSTAQSSMGSAMPLRMLVPKLRAHTGCCEAAATGAPPAAAEARDQSSREQSTWRGEAGRRRADARGWQAVRRGACVRGVLGRAERLTSPAGALDAMRAARFITRPR